MKRLLSVMILAAAPLAAQFSSAIQGTITDTSQAVVPDAAVTITQVATGVIREARSAHDGSYRVPSLGPGDYNVHVEKQGFQGLRRSGVSLGSDAVLRLDFVLQIGAVADSVTVTGAGPMVETEQGRVTASVDGTQLKEMPLKGRNIYNIIAIQPGVTGKGLGGAAITGSNDMFAGETQPDISASGQRYEGNNFTVDDSSVNSVTRAGVSNITPNADSVEEVRVVANNFSAIDGRSPGAQIQVVTKSGKNQFFGTVSNYFANNTLSARNYLENNVPVFRKNQYNYTIGGPIRRNRTFFFHSFEGLRQSGGRGQQATVETAQFRNFVDQTRPNSIAAILLRNNPPTSYPTVGLRDTGSPRPGINISGPADGIPDLGNIVYIPASFRNANQVSLRIDHELRPGKERLYGSFYRTSADTLNGGVRPKFDRGGNELTYFGNLNLTQILSPTIVNEIRAGVNRLAGLRSMPGTLDVPGITITGTTGFSISGAYPQGYFQTNYHLRDVLSWTRGAHTLKVGGELRILQDNQRNTFNYLPAYTFANIFDFADDEPLQMTRYVDPRTGTPATASGALRGKEWALYINDDFKVSRRLSLSLGLRYENYGTLKDPTGQLRGLIFGPGNNYLERLASAKVDVLPALYNTNKLNLGPRLGFAWDATGNGRTSVRGGFGLSFDHMPTLPIQDYRNNPPLRATVDAGLLFGTTFTYSLGDLTKPYLGYPVDASLRRGLDEHNGIKGSRVDIRTIDPNYTSPYTYNWFLGIQREVIPNLVVEAGYLGSAGHHLLNARNVNRMPGDLLDGKFDGINPSFSAIWSVESTSNSIYHGGTVSVRRAFRRGVSLQANLTYGKSIADTDSVTANSIWQDTWDRRAERAVTSFDAPRRLSALGVWEIPFLRGNRALLGRLFGGWQAAGFMILQSGLPFTPVNNAAYPRGDYNADNSGGDRPNAPTPDTKTSGWSRSDFVAGVLPISAFPTPGRGADGNLGRNTFRGPGFAWTDLSLSKRFVISERITAQLRLDDFNAFNRVNLNNPVVNLNDGINFGKSIASLAPRAYQIGLRFEFGPSSAPGGAGIGGKRAPGQK